MKLTDFKKKLLQNDKLRAEFERYDLAFEISQAILEVRILQGITQAKLASQISTKQSAIARAESGKNLPSLLFLSKIAEALGTKLKVSFESVEKAHIKTSAETYVNKEIITFGVTSQYPFDPSLYGPIAMNSGDSMTVRGA